MSRRVYCDECSVRFTIKLRKKRLPRGVEHTSFKCPECGEVYDVSYTNKPIRKLHERLNYLRAALSNETDSEAIAELQRHIEGMTKESRKLMSELKERFKEDE